MKKDKTAQENSGRQARTALTKRELAVCIAAECGLNQMDVLAVVQRTLDYIAEALLAGRHVEFRDFGVFEVAMRKARIGRNPNKPLVTVRIPERRVVKFKIGKLFKARLLAGTKR